MRLLLACVAAFILAGFPGVAFGAAGDGNLPGAGASVVEAKPAAVDASAPEPKRARRQAEPEVTAVEPELGKWGGIVAGVLAALAGLWKLWRRFQRGAAHERPGEPASGWPRRRP